ncbi:MAG: F0F1 ATP synthase subunit A [Actinomycetota bacterium]|nr:F0F1 ATP synthase subunit A [Actinomycetota bacterium]
MEKESFDVLHELAPKVLYPLKVGGIDISITNTVVTMFAAVIVAAAILIIAARKTKLVPGPFQNAMEIIIEFIRNDIIISMIGKDGLPWFPFLGTIFFFILFNNLLGLVPFSNTPTGRLSGPLTLAVIVFLSIHVYGIRKHGLIKYFAGWIPPGLPIFIQFIVFPLEAISAIAKPFSLTVRLFANILAGHVIIFVFLGFAIMFDTLYVVPLSLPMVIIMMCLEVLFSAIQAYVFTVLSAMYIGAAINPEH